MPLPNITQEFISELASDSSYWKGVDYYEKGAVKKVWREGTQYKAHVYGTELYTVTVWEDEEGKKASCTCPYDWGGICKHSVAAMLALMNRYSPQEHEDIPEESIPVEKLIRELNPEKLREFLTKALKEDSKLHEDFEIFARGDRETDLKVEDYKRQIVKVLKSISPRPFHHYDYYEDYREYSSPIEDAIDSFFEMSEKYLEQKNYKESLKIYQALFETCIKETETETLEDYGEDLYYYASKAIERWGEVLSQAPFPLDEKKAYLDYALSWLARTPFNKPEPFEKVFADIVRTKDEAKYLLKSIQGMEVPPEITFHLLRVSGDIKGLIQFGEAHYLNHNRLALPLAEIYKGEGFKEKAINVAERVIDSIHRKTERFYRYHDIQIPLRAFLLELYDKEADYHKIISNLMVLLDLTGNIEYYKRLRGVLKTESERKQILEGLEKSLKDQVELLFKIYVIEKDEKRLLDLARRNLESTEFPAIIERIQHRYPMECFDLYRKKINAFLKDNMGRRYYRQVAYWLRVMKKIPGTAEDFRKYVNEIRITYKPRRALLQEMREF